MKHITLAFFLLFTTSVYAQDKIPEVGSEYQGGIVVYKNNDHGLIMAKSPAPDLMIWEMAKYYCENLEIDGNKGWRLANNLEWIQIYKFWTKTRLSNLKETNVWWSATSGGTIEGRPTAYIQYLTDGSQTKCDDRDYRKYSVMPVRSF